MDKERAKSFVFKAEDSKKIYVSKDLQKLLDKSDGMLINVFAIVETESGDTLCYMDWSYSGEPIIMGRFIHSDFFFKHYCASKVVDLDK